MLLDEIPTRELWTLNTVHRNNRDRAGVRDTGNELMSRTNTSKEARIQANRKQAEWIFQYKMAQKATEAGK